VIGVQASEGADCWCSGAEARGFRSSRCTPPAAVGRISHRSPSCWRGRRAIVRSAAGSPGTYLPPYRDFGHL